MKISEYQMQVSFFDEIRMMANSEPRLRWCYAYMANSAGNVKVASKNKAAGQLKGVWDVFLPVGELVERPSDLRGYKFLQNCSGLYLEFKVKGKTLTKEQKEFRKDLERFFNFEICYSAEEGIKAVKQYLNIGA